MPIRPTRSRLVVVSGALLTVFSIGPAASAFSVLQPGGGSTVQEVLQGAGRWSSISGLSDGIQVGVNFAADLSAYYSDVTPYNQVLADAFAAWESPSLNFDITFDDPGVEEGVGSGFEIDVFAVPGSHSIFATNTFSGYARFGSFYSTDRPLTNGQSFAGWAISGADIFFNIDRIVALAMAAPEMPFSQFLDALQLLFMHEVGHALGLAHPNSNDPYGVATNYDTNGDPLDAMFIDPVDPFGDLIVSAYRDDTAVMSNRPCGEPFVAPCAALFFTSLQNDDLGGRDALYPIPEPTTTLLLALGLAGLAAAGRRR